MENGYESVREQKTDTKECHRKRTRKNFRETEKGHERVIENRKQIRKSVREQKSDTKEC